MIKWFLRNRYQCTASEKRLLLLSCSRQPNRVRPSKSGQKGQKNGRVERARGAKGEFEAFRIELEGESRSSLYSHKRSE